MKYIFESNFANDIDSYIRLRTSLGNMEDTFARRLKSFDSHCIQYYPDDHILTQEICESWCTLRENEKPATLQLRTRILRDFSKYLRSLGREVYVIPDGYIGKPARYLPYIYTDDELSTFFESADSIKPHKLSPLREYIIPVLFRMLYCCGLRPQEIPLLAVSDVNLDNGMIRITDSKRHKDRFVVMSQDLQTLCKEYSCHMEYLIPGRKYFFQFKPDSCCSVRWVQAQFYRCWRNIGKEFSNDHHPRVYDFRHNFATRVIRSWMNEGLDVMSKLPYLSSYMGHESIEYTAYYIHLVPDHLTDSGKTNWDTGIEVPSYE